jgi:fibro-slime domain-containing protein
MFFRSLWSVFSFVFVAGLAVAGFCSCSDSRSRPTAGDGGTGNGDSTTQTDSGSGGDARGENDGSNPLIDGHTSPNTIDLTGRLRDFHDTHPDFEAELGVDPGIVEEQLGGDDKPVYAGGSGTATTHGQQAFDQWYRDTAGVNMSMEHTITLTRGAGGVYTYDNQEFFPADNEMFGNEGRDHNFHFTFELHTEFTYGGGEVFGFTGDDDLFVFINGRLAIDLGGVHGAMSQEVNLDDAAADLDITPGNIYRLDFFFAERHTDQSTFRIDTTIDTLTPVIE